MKKEYVLAIDQSTSGTKAMLFDRTGRMTMRVDLPHKQIVDERGWVEHDGEEIWRNTVQLVHTLMEKARVNAAQLAAVGISNQRETGILWEKGGTPVANAVVWQCPRGAELCTALERQGAAQMVRSASGLRLSPYFTAAKLAWLLQNVPATQQALKENRLLAGTMDAYLLYRLTGRHCTDYSNASRTQLFNIHTLSWDDALCKAFGVPHSILPQVCDSDADYGTTTFDGVLSVPVPVRSVMGDSHAALFAQGCTREGLGKATYGTGSSVMIHTGGRAVDSEALVTSLAWSRAGKAEYVLEGNINYAGAVLGWLRDEMELVHEVREVQQLAESVADTGGVYLVPAFTGLGAPHWDTQARALLCGMTRTTAKAQIARAAEECIAYQVSDILFAARAAGVLPQSLRADGGPTRDAFLMQFQADIAGIAVEASTLEELSGAGAAYMAGLAVGLYDEETLSEARTSVRYAPQMEQNVAEGLYKGWQAAVRLARHSAE